MTTEKISFSVSGKSAMGSIIYHLDVSQCNGVQICSTPGPFATEIKIFEAEEEIAPRYAIHGLHCLYLFLQMPVRQKISKDMFLQ